MRAVVLSFALSLSGCATYWQASDLEEKVDRLLQNTKRETLTQIFGEQSSEITRRMETLSGEEKQQLEQLMDSYQQGSGSIEEVRTNMMSVMGGSTRSVSAGSGIWVRDESGNKLTTISRNAKLKECRRLGDDEVPERISSNRGLKNYTWGTAKLKGQTVLFPWELTMSEFAKEIVENTARRTAQEVLRMSGDKGWQRPVQIQVITDQPGQSVTITHPGEEEIYVVPGDPKPAPEPEK